MRLQLVEIRSRGVLEMERVVVRVIVGGNIGDFMVFPSLFDGGRPTTQIGSAFWFPDKKVTRGDLIVLFTGEGDDHEGEAKDGSTIHRYYWGRRRPQWADVNWGVVLANISAWEARR